MDMVRECMKGDRPFGVCRIVSGSETGAAAEHEALAAWRESATGTCRNWGCCT